MFMRKTFEKQNWWLFSARISIDNKRSTLQRCSLNDIASKSWNYNIALLWGDWNKQFIILHQRFDAHKCLLVSFALTHRTGDKASSVWSKTILLCWPYPHLLPTAHSRFSEVVASFTTELKGFLAIVFWPNK